MQGDIVYQYHMHRRANGSYFISVVQPRIAGQNTYPGPQASRHPQPGPEPKTVALLLQPSQPSKKNSQRSAASPPNKRPDNESWLLGDKEFDNLLAAGNPIKLGHLPPNAAAEKPVYLGQLILRDSTHEADQPHRDAPTVDASYGDHSFDVIYRRPHQPDIKSIQQDSVSAEDAALISRVFMLCKIAVARREIQDTLTSVGKQLNKLNTALGIIEDKSDIYGAAAKADAQNRLCDLLHEVEHGHGHATDHHPANKQPSSTLVRVENRLAMVTSQVQHYLGRHKLPMYGGIGGALLIALAWIWLPYYLDYHNPFGTLMSSVLLVALVLVAAVFLLNALNLKSIRLRIQERLHEHTITRLNTTLASLVQTNANVAAINVEPPPGTAMPSEILLHEMDQALHIKERLSSIERVIKAREIHLNSSVQHIEEHRNRVKRSIVAAGSGIFVGYFTYEVGESLMEYLHVAHLQDRNAMLYWLFANRPAFETRAAATITTQDVAAYQPAFITGYHRPELYAHSWLLTITIVVSVITALIAIRKPAAEHGAGHGHH